MAKDNNPSTARVVIGITIFAISLAAFAFIVLTANPDFESGENLGAALEGKGQLLVVLVIASGIGAVIAFPGIFRGSGRR